MPAYSVTCLFRALDADLDEAADIICTVHGPNNDDQDDDVDGADLEEQVLEAIHRPPCRPRPRPTTGAGAVAVVPQPPRRGDGRHDPPPNYEVDVPIRSTETPGLEGVHVFTGWADGRSAALRAAHEVYDAARAAAEAGHRRFPTEVRRLGRPADTDPAGSSTGPPRRPAERPLQLAPTPSPFGM